jgi:hypothetical protein
MDADPAPANVRASLSKPLARSYLAVVAFVWLAHATLLVLGLIVGRWSWTTDSPWVAVPGMVAILLCLGVVWLVDQRLDKVRRRTPQAFRWLSLAYGSATPEAWRRLRA